MTKGEVTGRAHAELAGRGRVDVSLRELGRAIGVSARMLVYYFGSREELLVAVMDHERALQREQLAALQGSGAGPVELLRGYFHMVTEPDKRARIAFFFGLTLEAVGKPDRYETFLKEGVVGYWTRAMEEIVRGAGYPAVPEAVVSAVLAAARGLYLELLATGEVERVRSAFEQVLVWVDGELARGGTGSVP